jgi:hypothetical protein
MPITPLLAVALALNSFPAGSKSSLNVGSRSAVITFSGLWNGIDPYTNYTVPHRPIPSNYQPLLGTEPFTKPVDGGDLGIQIGWDTAQCSNHGLNGNVKDHTGDAMPDGKEPNHELGGSVMFALGPCAVTFSKPVEIPSLFWTFYEPAKLPVSKNGTISVFQDISDTTPLKSVEVPYSDTKGFVWRELTAFEGLKIARIVFDPRGQNTGLNIDDIQIRVNGDK